MYHSVLVVVDSSPWSRLAVLDAADLALAMSARLTILCPVPRVPQTAHLAAIAPGAPLPPQQLAADAERECMELCSAAVALVPPDVPVTTLTPSAPATVAVTREVLRGGHDVVVVAAPRPGLQSLWHAATARRLARRCPVPVLTVPAPRRDRVKAHRSAGTRARVGAAIPR